MDSTNLTFFAPCPRGLESALAGELVALGAEQPALAAGGVGFRGSFDLCFRANLESRIASRILWRISQGQYRSEDDLYALATAVPWGEWFSPQYTIKVKVSAQRAPLRSLDFATLRIKDAVCDHFRALGKPRPDVDTQRPDFIIHAFLDTDSCILYLDTSGEPLFKRGFRQAGGEAPLRENLAAGILKLAGWTPDRVLLDPMCGSATIPIEAALMAQNIPPGLGRHFAFEKFKNFKPKRWADICDERRPPSKQSEVAGIFAGDSSAEAIKHARQHLRAAGLSDVVDLHQADVLQTTAPSETGLLVTNPPYGKRSSAGDELLKWYPRLGDALKHNFPGWKAYLLTGDSNLAKFIGLAPSRRTPLFNGALECRLLEFDLVRGAMRGRKRAAPSHVNQEPT